ncbi:hypothetical protein ABZ281_43695 [Streptomyces sp. NPDC006265]|uniref:hypothetical protein n=1 Tax=Streptomyces sp. NPDC006265 TaxID=3156740 RepID=UPI0033BB1892
MDRDDQQLLRRRIYGADHDEPGPHYAELVGGPLDGLLLRVTSWTQDEADTCVALSAELGQFGAGGRALYDPRHDAPDCWDWTAHSS